MWLCHSKDSAVLYPLHTSNQMNSLIVLAKQEFGENMKVYDVNNLKTIHVQRQQRNIQLYTDCTRCHPDDVPGTIPQPEEAGANRSRAGNGFRIFPRFRE